MLERLQKIIARAGITSRRAAEELILQGRVKVNGAVVFALGTKADAETDHIKVDGKMLRESNGPPIYLMLHKPKSCMTTRHDPEGRPTVMDLLKRLRSRVYPIGRLDYHSEGLLLFTNDGDFAERVLTAKSEVPKTYHVKINGQPTDEDLRKLREGVKLDGRPTAPAKVVLLRQAVNPWYEVTLIEGRNNQIRRMFLKRGLLVEKLKRVKIGSMALGRLPAGEFRHLKPEEVAKMLRRSQEEKPSNETKTQRRPKAAKPPNETKTPRRSKRVKPSVGAKTQRRPKAAKPPNETQTSRRPKAAKPPNETQTSRRSKGVKPSIRAKTQRRPKAAKPPNETQTSRRPKAAKPSVGAKTQRRPKAAKPPKAATKKGRSPHGRSTTSKRRRA